MSDTRSPSTVLVGIDGSDTAVGAAQWAVDEAISRSVPLRLIYVVKATHESAAEYSEQVDHAKTSLRAAKAAVEGTGKPVEVETAILGGPPGEVLVEQSEGAALCCVGTTGIGRYARSIVGSTAAELAEKAHCPVAVIRLSGQDSPQHLNWIVVGFDDRPHHEAVVAAAMQEANLRRDPVLLLGNSRSRGGSKSGLDREAEKWKTRYPDVHIYPIVESADVAQFVKKHDEPVALAVIGAPDAGNLAQIIGHHHVLQHTMASALVVRGGDA